METITIKTDTIQKYLSNKKFTDLKLILKDETDTIELDVHSIILSSLSPYFDRLLSFNKQITEQLMIVDNAQIMADTIMSLYGYDPVNHQYPDWYYKLEMIKCRSYLCLDYNLSELHNLKIPDNGFDLLLQVAELFDSSNMSIIKLIKYNLPQNYDINSLPKKIIDDLNHTYHITIGCLDGSIIGYAIENHKILFQYKHSTDPMGIYISNKCDFIIYGDDYYNLSRYDIKTDNNYILPNCKYYYGDICISNDDLTVTFLNDKYEIVTVDLTTMNIIKKIKLEHQSIIRLKFSQDKKYVVFGGENGGINIIDLESGEYILRIVGNDQINAISISYDNLLIASGSYGGIIKIWNFVTGVCMNTIYNDGIITDLEFSPDAKQIAWSSTKNIVNIFNIDSGNICNLPGHSRMVNCIAYSPNGSYLLSGSDDSTIKIWDPLTGDCIDTIDMDNRVTTITFFK